MVDIKDLMCENWIFLSDPEDRENTTACFQISEIREKGIRVEDFTDIYEQEYFAPIPVTEEILKNIGFEEYKDPPFEGKFLRYWDKDYKYKLDVRDFWTNSQRKWYIHVDNDVCNTIGCGEFDYVHELQNLVRVITRHDLPITKEMIDGKVDK